MDTTHALVGDIGGTNCRLALARDGELIRESIHTYAVSQFPTLTAAAENYLQQHNANVHSACLAIAGPVGGDWVQFTNAPWKFSIEATRAELGLQRLQIINDFEAVGLSLPHLRQEQLRKIGGGEIQAGQPKVALGPGTGYGATHVIQHGSEFIAIPTEGGHISVAPSTQLEIDLFAWALRQNLQITCEQFLSGPGLKTLHRGLYALKAQNDLAALEAITAADVQVRGVDGSDPICSEALNLFCELLGTAARDQALGTLALGGVYIAGGIVQRFIPFLRASKFRERFENSATMRAILEKIPVYVITEENPGLVGAAAVTRQH
jgi:glucokinase